MSIEAMKQMLDALQYIYSDLTPHEDQVVDEAIQAGRAAIEQAEKQEPHYTWQYAKDYIASRQAEKQEPVAWLCKDDEGQLHDTVLSDKTCKKCFPVYTAPPQREWVGLTDEEIWNTYKSLWMFHPAEEPRLAGDILKFACAIETKLKEKNT